VNNTEGPGGPQLRLYVADQCHLHLAEDRSRKGNPNVGSKGEHATFVVPALNRSHHTNRLCRSIAEYIPEFQGEVLIVDNGSHSDEISSVEMCLSGMPFRASLVRLGENLGPAGARNRAMDFVKTAWVISLDNDVYFLGNPLPSLQRDIAVLGCHFLSLAILNPDGTNFLRGGHLRVDDDGGRLHITPESVMGPDVAIADGPGYLATYLPGGGSVFRKDSFLAQGGFDPQLFAFEDCEFSLRLFRAGLKVGASDTRVLVHDHSRHPDQLEYENVRFNWERLRNSAQYFEAKHGLSVWNTDVEQWIINRRSELMQPEDVSHPGGAGGILLRTALCPGAGSTHDEQAAGPPAPLRQLQDRLSECEERLQSDRRNYEARLDQEQQLKRQLERGRDAALAYERKLLERTREEYEARVRHEQDLLRRLEHERDVAVLHERALVESTRTEYEAQLRHEQGLLRQLERDRDAALAAERGLLARMRSEYETALAHELALTEEMRNEFAKRLAYEQALHQQLEQERDAALSYERALNQQLAAEIAELQKR
jgi:GT2 family glycosyltransferase